jgi:hypothetical protein
VTNTVYRFETYDIVADEMRMSRRWGTREGIENITDRIVGDGIEVSDE